MQGGITMRLFHVSEESDIRIFNPRTPIRVDLDKNLPLVWAIEEKCLPNFLTPRDCPRIGYYIGENATKEDTNNFFTSKGCNHVVVIENGWFQKILNTKLYLYEFDPSNFQLQDEIAGYYVSKTPEKPIGKFEISNLFEELFNRNVELRVVDNLWNFSNTIKNSSLCWSLCRMNNASK